MPPFQARIVDSIDNRGLLPRIYKTVVVVLPLLCTDPLSLSLTPFPPCRSEPKPLSFYLVDKGSFPMHLCNLLCNFGHTFASHKSVQVTPLWLVTFAPILQPTFLGQSEKRLSILTLSFGQNYISLFFSSLLAFGWPIGCQRGHFRVSFSIWSAEFRPTFASFLE